MTQWRSAAYQAVKDKVAQEYRPGSAWPAARRWLSRVGLVRLTATGAAGDALSLLRSINRSTYRNEPEIAELLDVAREAMTELYQAQVDADWQRFNGTKRKAAGA